jgi:uncharacterized membrane protein YccC
MQTDPRRAGIGAGYNLMFGNSLGIENMARFDPAGLLNDGLSQLLGVGLAGLAFALLLPADNRRLRLHLVRSLRRQVLLACFGPLRGLRHRLENSTRDLLNQLLAGADRVDGEDRSLLARALTVLETGRAVIELRAAAARGTLAIGGRAALRAGVRAVARLFEKPTPQRRARAIEGVSDVMLRVADAAQQAAGGERQALLRCRAGLHLLRVLLLDDEAYAAFAEIENACLREPGRGA